MAHEMDLRQDPSVLVDQTVESVVTGEYGDLQVIHFAGYTVLIGCDLAGENTTDVYPRLKPCPTRNIGGLTRPCPDCTPGLLGWTLAV